MVVALIPIELVFTIWALTTAIGVLIAFYAGYIRGSRSTLMHMRKFFSAKSMEKAFKKMKKIAIKKKKKGKK